MTLKIKHIPVGLLALLGGLPFMGTKISAMNDEFDLMRRLGEMGGEMHRGISEYHRQEERRERAAFNELKDAQRRIINGPFTQAEQDAARAEIARLDQEEARRKLDNLGAKRRTIEKWDDTARSITPMIAQEIIGERSKERQKEIEGIKAVQDRKAKVEAAAATTKMYIDFVKQNPWLIVAIPVGITAGYYGIKHGSQYIADQAKIPSLATETSMLSFTERAKNWLSGSAPEKKDLKDVKLDPVTAARIQETATGLKNVVANGSFLKNMLFWGPPGTGKTMSALRVARSCGLEYMYFAGTDLLGFSEEEGIKKLRELFGFAKKYGTPVVVVIDEAELVLGSRSNPNMTNKQKVFLNEILTYTGTETREYMVIALTNRPEDLDEAFLSRCDDRIFIGTPDVARRREILDHYIEENLIKESKPVALQKGWFSGWFSAAPAPAAQLKIAEDALSDEARTAIVAQIDGFVGRDIMKLVNQLKFSAYQTENCTLTAEIVTRVVATKVAERAAQQLGFNRRDAQAALAQPARA